MRKYVIFVTAFLIIVATLATINVGIEGIWVSKATITDNMIDEKDYMPFTEDDLFALKNNFHLSREYQIKMRKTKLTNRNETINKFQQQIAQILQLPELLLPGNATVRYQFNSNATQCGMDFTLRTRKYYTGYKAGVATIDVKAATEGFAPASKIIDKFWLPGEHYNEGAELKFEWDIHPCKIKYSVETRIIVPFDLEVPTCRHFLHLFPAAAEVVTDREKLSSNYSVSLPGWWWELEHVGWMQDGMTQYKTAIIIPYESREGAENGLVAPMYLPEWSIRLYSTNHGKGRWVRSTLEDMEEKYSSILTIIGTPDLPCRGVHIAGRNKTV